MQIFLLMAKECMSNSGSGPAMGTGNSNVQLLHSLHKHQQTDSPVNIVRETVNSTPLEVCCLLVMFLER